MSYLLESFKKKEGLRRYFGPKRALILLGFGYAMWFVWSMFRSGDFSPAILQHYHYENPTATVMMFIAFYAITVVAAIPSLPLNLAAGYFWGGVLGGVYTCIGVTIGGFVSFLFARYVIGQPLTPSLSDMSKRRWLVNIQREFEQHGWKYIAFVRMNPIVPTGAFNFFLGLTSVSNKTFLWTTFVFLLPPTIAVSFIGDAFQTFSADGQVTEIINTIFMVSAAIMALCGIRFAAKIFKR